MTDIRSLKRKCQLTSKTAQIIPTDEMCGSVKSLFKESDFHRICTEKLQELVALKNSIIVTEEKYREAVDILMGRYVRNTNLKYWIKKKQMKLVDIPHLEESKVLVVPKSKYLSYRFSQVFELLT